MSTRHMLWVVAGLLMTSVVTADTTKPTSKKDAPKTAEKKVQEKKVDDKKLSELDPGWMPRKETTALQFLLKHPKYDGRDVVVAIFDTGVDPGAAGLQVTPDGRPKIVDMIDGTGSGDVDMSASVKESKGTLKGKSGRTLKLGGKIQCPSGEYRVGLKAGYDFFPTSSGRPELVERLKSETADDLSDEQQKAVSALMQKLAEWKRTHPKPDKAQKAELKELEAQLELLKALPKQIDDVGPLYDCVVYHDGERYRAVIDTDRDGDLGDETPLTNYREERKYSKFPEPVQLNFAVNIYDEGRTLSIVTDCGAHGTHVAGIVGAYFEESPQLNGVAPGVQFVSVKIGDTRIEGMEAAAGLMRGIQAVKANGCDLVNMSYGEQAAFSNHGRIIEEINRLVGEEGVIFVSSAGNSGPALTTVGAPGGTTSSVIGVGAYVSDEMAAAEYAARETSGPLPYTWTSRGPTIDGDLGVDIFAPGGAIAPVPTWTLRRKQQMNGTSMASPNACGCLALLLSGAKAEKLSYTPFSMEQTIQATAKDIKGISRFAQGPGLLQVEAAWNHLTSYHQSSPYHYQYEIDIPALDHARGIYLREHAEANRLLTTKVYVTPQFKDDEPQQTLLDFEVPLQLTSTVDWVDVGDSLFLTAAGERFEVQVDPRELPSGVHYAEILAIDPRTPKAGPVFRVPVTVVRSTAAEELTDYELEFWYEEELVLNPGQEERYFLEVPASASYCEIELVPIEVSHSPVVRLHTLQLIDGDHFEKHEGGNYLPLSAKESTQLTIPVIGNRVMELCLVQYWSYLGETELLLRTRFGGVKPSEQSIALQADGPYVRLDLAAKLRPENTTPSAKLTTRRRYLKPSKAEIIAGTAERDTMVNDQIVHTLQLTYNWAQSSAGGVTPSFPGLIDLLYDAAAGPYLLHIYDENGARVVTKDMFASPARLKAGKYTLVANIRDHSLEDLEGMKSLALALDQSLSKPVNVKVTKGAAFEENGNGSVRGLWISKGAVASVHLKAPSRNALPKEVQPGDVLLGEMTLLDEKPSSIKLSLAVTGEAKGGSGGGGGSAGGSLEDQIVALKMAHLKTLDPEKEEFGKLFEELRTAKAESLEPLVTKLHLLDSEAKRKERLEAVISAADELIEAADANKIAAVLGLRTPDSDDKEAVKAYKQAQKAKSQLMDALYRKARAIGYRELPEVLKKAPIEDVEAQAKAYNDSLKALARWVDLNDPEYVLLLVRKHRRQKEYAQAINLLNKYLSKSDNQSLWLKKRRDMLKQLGWEEWASRQHDALLVHYPKKEWSWE